MQGYLEKVIDIKEQLQQDLTRQQVTYPLNVRQFSSSWFVYLRLFFRCIRKLADMHLKYPTLLPLPAKRMHMAHFSSCALESILGQYTLDKMLNLPKLTKKFDAAFSSFSTDSKRLHFKFSVSSLCSTDLIFAKCTKVVLKGATEQVAGETDTCAAESVTEALGNADNTETMEVDSDDDGQDDDDDLVDTLIDDAPQDFDDFQVDGNENAGSKIDPDHFRRTTKSCEEIQYYIMSKNEASAAIPSKVELAVDMGLNRPFAVFRPSNNQQRMPKEQICACVHALAQRLFTQSWRRLELKVVVIQ